MARAPLSADAIAAALTDLSGWTHESGALVKTYTLPSYTGGLVFASAVGALCEGMDHHPDLIVSYKKVTVKFSTHDAGNAVTSADVQAAQAVESLGYPKA